MGLAPDAATATRERPATPKLSWIAPPDSYRSSSGVMLAKQEIDVLARILSMGKLHHAYTGTGAIAVAVAAVLPGSIVERCMAKKWDYSGSDPVAPQVAKRIVRIGHASGRLSIGASVSRHDNVWRMERAILSRSARVIMSGWVQLLELRMHAAQNQAQERSNPTARPSRAKLSSSGLTFIGTKSGFSGSSSISAPVFR